MIFPEGGMGLTLTKELDGGCSVTKVVPGGVAHSRGVALGQRVCGESVFRIGSCLIDGGSHVELLFRHMTLAGAMLCLDRSEKKLDSQKIFRHSRIGHFTLLYCSLDNKLTTLDPISRGSLGCIALRRSCKRSAQRHLRADYGDHQRLVKTDLDNVRYPRRR